MKDTAQKQEWNLRDLAAGDLFPMVSLLGKIGISQLQDKIGDDILKASRFTPPVRLGKKGETIQIPKKDWTEAQKRAEAAASAAQSRAIMVGVEVVLNNFSNCKDEIYSLLASGYSVEPEDIEELPLTEFINLLDGYVNRDAFGDFFTQALKLVSHTGTFISRINFSGDMVQE